jgi:hypothetical protein
MSARPWDRKIDIHTQLTTISQQLLQVVTGGFYFPPGAFPDVPNFL